MCVIIELAVPLDVAAPTTKAEVSAVCSDQPTGRLALVFELMDMNIYELIRGRSHYVAEERIRRYMYQLIKAMDHMHKAGIFHR